MSETTERVLYAAGFVVIMTPFMIYAWTHAARDAAKAIAKLNPPDGLDLPDSGTQWLRAQLVRRTRWSVVGTEAMACMFAVVVFLGDSVSMIAETSHAFGAASFIAGFTVGGALATIHSARANQGHRRSAPLIPRTLSTYLRRWEGRLYAAHLSAAAMCTALVGAFWLGGQLERGPGVFYLGLMLVWTLLVGSVRLLQLWVLRTPPIVDENLHMARELMISIAVRALAAFQLPLIAIAGLVGATYAWLHGAIASETVAVAPLYGAGLITLAAYVARTHRDDRGEPSPEWHFARTLEPST